MALTERTTSLPSKDDLIHYVQRESEIASKAMLVIPYLDDERLEAFDQLMKTRSEQSFMARCFIAAVRKQRGQMKEWINRVNERAASPRERMSRAWAYVLARVFDLLHEGWHEHFDLDANLGDEALAERVNAIMDDPPFRLASDIYEWLVPTHFTDLAQYAPEGITSEEAHRQLKLANDNRMTVSQFREHVKERWQVEEKSSDEPNKSEKQGERIENLKREVEIAQEEATTYRREAEDLRAKLRAAEPDPADPSLPRRAQRAAACQRRVDHIFADLMDDLKEDMSPEELDRTLDRFVEDVGQPLNELYDELSNEVEQERSVAV